MAWPHRLNRIPALLLAAASTAAAAAEKHAHPAAWTRPADPFRILGNVHYVGTAGIGAFLITGDQGHVLIDGGLPENAPMIAANIRKLGFRLTDVKYLLINHAHFDHAGGLAELKRLTGATLVASEGDRADLEAGRNAGRPELPSFPKVRVDQTVADGKVLRLGSIALTARLTPGHTKGCTSWTTSVQDRTILFACSITVAGQRLAGDPAYPAAAADFRSTFGKLREMTADVYLTFHSEVFGMAEKRAKQQQGDTEAFVDPDELRRQVARAMRTFEAELAQQQ